MKYVLAFVLCLVILSCKNVYRSLDGEKTLVALQPLEHVPDKLLDSVAASIRQLYHFEVIVLPEKDMPKDAFVNVKSPRYRAEKLIAWLWKTKPDSVDYIIGITQKDISTTKRDAFGRVKDPAWKYEDWGIMGLGYCPGKSCVVSTFRLKANNAALFTERSQKVAVHELGHNLWLPHCPEPGCVMNSANESIKTVDKEKLGLCEKCRHKVKN